MTALVPRLFGDMTDWFDVDLPSFRGHLVRIEDSQTDTEYVLRAELPGLQPDKDIQLTLHDGLLTVRAERHEQETTSRRSEFRYGLMHRVVRLPVDADTKHVKASYRDGILEINVPLRAPSDTRTIPITA